jgi:hypothetical protein
MKKFIILLLLLSSSLSFAGERHLDPTLVPWFPYVSMFYYTAGTYYISNAGSNASAGTSAGTAWSALPGMPTCTGVCATYGGAIPSVPGDTFCMRGADTWGKTQLGVNWQWGGTTLARITVGACSGFGTGNPILDCQSDSTCANNLAVVAYPQFYVNTTAPYVTLDGIELKGINIKDHDARGVAWNVNNFELKNFNIHGWSRNASISNFPQAVMVFGDASVDPTGTSVHHGRVDGSDTNYAIDGGMVEAYSNIYDAYNLYAGYTYDGFVGLFQNIHDSVVEHIQPVLNINGRHCNMLYQYSMYNSHSTTSLIYNNVFRHLDADGCFVVALQGQDDALCVGCNTYLFNNILFDDDRNGNAIGAMGMGGNPAFAGTCNYGTLWAYFNTVANTTSLGIIGNGLAIGTNCGGVPTVTVHMANNHGITPAAQLGIAAGATIIDDGGNLKQSAATATAQGYTAAQVPYPYFPTVGGSTIGGGTTIACVACGSAYGTSFNGLARTNPPDIGIYQFVASASTRAAKLRGKQRGKR